METFETGGGSPMESLLESGKNHVAQSRPGLAAVTVPPAIFGNKGLGAENAAEISAPGTILSYWYSRQHEILGWSIDRRIGDKLEKVASSDVPKTPWFPASTTAKEIEIRQRERIDVVDKFISQFEIPANHAAELRKIAAFDVNRAHDEVVRRDRTFDLLHSADVARFREYLQKEVRMLESIPIAERIDAVRRDREEAEAHGVEPSAFAQQRASLKLGYDSFANRWEHEYRNISVDCDSEGKIRLTSWNEDRADRVEAFAPWGHGGGDYIHAHVLDQGNDVDAFVSACVERVRAENRLDQTMTAIGELSRGAAATAAKRFQGVCRDSETGPATLALRNGELELTRAGAELLGLNPVSAIRVGGKYYVEAQGFGQSRPAQLIYDNEYTESHFATRRDYTKRAGASAEIVFVSNLKETAAKLRGDESQSGQLARKWEDKPYVAKLPIQGLTEQTCIAYLKTMREQFGHASEAEKVKIRQDVSDAIRDFGGSDVTGLPLKLAADKYVTGAIDHVGVVENRAAKHFAAIDRAPHTKLRSVDQALAR